MTSRRGTKEAQRERPRTRSLMRDESGSTRKSQNQVKARIIREFEQHDGSAADFCRQHEVSYQEMGSG